MTTRWTLLEVRRDIPNSPRHVRFTSKAHSKALGGVFINLGLPDFGAKRTLVGVHSAHRVDRSPRYSTRNLARTPPVILSRGYSGSRLHTSIVALNVVPVPAAAALLGLRAKLGFQPNADHEFMPGRQVDRLARPLAFRVA